MSYQSNPPPILPGDLNNLLDPETISFWIDLADFYNEENTPYIQYFDSFEHLKFLQVTSDLKKISQHMNEVTQ